MKESAFHRLHRLRMENDAAAFRMDEERPRFDALANRHEDGTAPRGVFAYQLFQTPPEIARAMAELLDIEPGARVLEPSAGLGRLLDAVAEYRPAEVVAVEKAPNIAGELFRQDRPGVTLKVRDFLEIHTGELGQFDAVIMNPPFHMRSDRDHINHALQFVKPGGRLVALCMDTHHRHDAFRHRADVWRSLPAGTFKDEGTNVSTILLAITKQ